MIKHSSLKSPIRFHNNRVTTRTPICLAIRVAAVLALIPGWLLAESQVLFDFEDGSLGQRWSAVGNVTASRGAIPEIDRDADSPAGNGVQVRTKGKGGIFAKSGVVERNWSGFESLSLWLHRSEDEAKRHPKSILEIQLYERDGKARRWRKVEVAHVGWKRIDLPLKWFRWSQGRAPRWDRVDRFGIWFRDAAAVTIDQIEVFDRHPSEGATASARDLAELAFPQTADANRKIAQRAGFMLVSDCPRLEMEKLADHLAGVRARLLRDWPMWKEASADAALIVFDREADYRKFAPRFSSRLNASATPPTSDGYTLQGIASSSWDERQGTLRPVYTHEFVHSMAAKYGRITDDGGWFQEGLAVHYQLEFHPQANIATIVLQGLDRADFRTPFAQLCTGKKIAGTRYWQAATLVDMLITEKRYSERLSALITAFEESGSTDLSEHLKPVFATDWDGLRRDWRAFCQQKYGD